ncbi:hypothetical protein [Xenorhabdus lircayensis]|uniref:N-acetyltransferase n=1 Tax=Xenorhabdus lircayensis TaxID=2763499 RepID=A0ABS0U695_9GAMM|nr:hypothetical protein [Xenorhabdus lircayensis]MBI6549406.1 hypothetical protein [Xenorhabdus lircayensis]
MLKRNHSFNSYMPTTSSNTLSRRRSFSAFPPEEIVSTEVAYKNPGLINGYIPIVKEVNKKQAIQGVEQILHSFQSEGWFCRTLKRVRYGETADQGKKRQEEIDAQKLWKIRYRAARNIALGIEKILEESSRIRNNPEGYAYFVCYIGSMPIGILLLTCFFYDKNDIFQENEPLYPEVSLLVTHPGIRNCSTLLVEQAVNKSYEIGSLGNLRLSVKNGSEILSNAVYARMGFIKLIDDDMMLKPAESNLWLFSPSYGGYRYKGYC